MTRPDHRRQGSHKQMSIDTQRHGKTQTGSANRKCTRSRLHAAGWRHNEAARTTARQRRICMRDAPPLDKLHEYERPERILEWQLLVGIAAHLAHEMRLPMYR